MVLTRAQEENIIAQFIGLRVYQPLVHAQQGNLKAHFGGLKFNKPKQADHKVHQVKRHNMTAVNYVMISSK